MLRRAGLFVLFSVLFAAWVLPAPALAHGPLLRGQQINRPGTVSTTTGDCVCDQRWYTVGLRPGSLTISGKVTNCQLSLMPGRPPLCQVFASLVDNGNGLARAVVSCSPKGHGCSNPLTLKYRIQHAGVYYLYIHGAGMAEIGLTMHVSGKIYRLHCGKYC